jgi:hypothetical protein
LAGSRRLRNRRTPNRSADPTAPKGSGETPVDTVAGTACPVSSETAQTLCRFFHRRRGYIAAVGPDTEQPGDLVREVEHGQSERTPVLALTGVTLAVAALVGVVLVIVVVVYLLA